MFHAATWEHQRKPIGTQIVIGCSEPLALMNVQRLASIRILEETYLNPCIVLGCPSQESRQIIPLNGTWRTSILYTLPNMVK